MGEHFAKITITKPVKALDLAAELKVGDDLSRDRAFLMKGRDAKPMPGNYRVRVRVEIDRRAIWRTGCCLSATCNARLGCV